MLNKLKYALITVLFILSLKGLYETDLINAVSLQSCSRKIYMPIAFWSIVILYTALFHLVFFKRSNNFLYSIKLGAIFGFITHIYLMLFGLVVSLTKDHVFLSEY